jgi:hypothetical protein
MRIGPEVPRSEDGAHRRQTFRFRPNEKGVDRLVKELYQLKHFGEDLQDVKQTVLAAHEVLNHEIPIKVKTRNSSRGVPFQTSRKSSPVTWPSDLVIRGNSPPSRRERVQRRQKQNQGAIRVFLSHLGLRR